MRKKQQRLAAQRARAQYRDSCGRFASARYRSVRVDEKTYKIPIDDKIESGSIVIVGATREQEQKVRRYIKYGFTKSEIRAATKEEPMLIAVADLEDAAGGYDPKNRMIVIDPDYVDAPMTTVHETVHYIKHNGGDKHRGPVTRTHINARDTPAEHNLEEASTTAEAVARCAPLAYQTPSYYGALRSRCTAEEMLRQDRRLFVGSDGRGLKGKRAIDAVEKKFDNSEIAKLQAYGARENARDHSRTLRR
ncbi:MAG: hypothetical protein RBR71_12090 [Gudongella sp.]|nr:hypothetical protein [Gudongella sp.]